VWALCSLINSRTRNQDITEKDASIKKLVEDLEAAQNANKIAREQLKGAIDAADAAQKAATVASAAAAAAAANVCSSSSPSHQKRIG
jgi:peptidoglycan hydrolase CwlO-like protein